MASGNSLIQFGPQANNPPASNYATLDTRNSTAVLDFDASTDESAVFVGELPRHYAGGGITVDIHWMASSATSGTCRWEACFERGNTDLDADSFATAKAAGGTASGTSGIETVTSIAFSNSEIDGLLINERFRLKIARDADGSGGTDDMAGDAELVLVSLRET